MMGCQNGKKVRTSRRAKKISLIELASEMGVDQNYLTQVELGEVQPPQERVEHILSVIKNWRKAGPFDCDRKDYKEFKHLRRKCKMTIVELRDDNSGA